jgi:hypothetical protein
MMSVMWYESVYRLGGIVQTHTAWQNLYYIVCPEYAVGFLGGKLWFYRLMGPGLHNEDKPVPVTLHKVVLQSAY